MRRAVQCEYRTVPYGGGVSLRVLSYLLLVLLATLEWQVVLVVTWSFSSVRAYKHDYCTAKTRV